jgi:hypothetical protein
VSEKLAAKSGSSVFLGSRKGWNWPCLDSLRLSETAIWGGPPHREEVRCMIHSIRKSKMEIPDKMGNPFISVVVLNYRRREELVRTLESVRTQTYRPCELIVVDNFSEDDSPAFLARPEFWRCRRISAVVVVTRGFRARAVHSW